MGSGNRYLFSIPRISGHLAWRGERTSATWSTRVRRTGFIELAFGFVPLTETTQHLLQVAAGGERHVPFASINGTTQEGVRVASESVYLSSSLRRSSPEGTRIRVGGLARRLKLQWDQLPALNDNVRLTYLLVGMRGFDMLEAQSAVGLMRIVAVSKASNPNTVSGKLQVTTDSGGQPLDDWITRCDQMVGRVLEVLSLALGRRIQWAVRLVVRDEKTLIADCRQVVVDGETSGLGNHLDLQRWLDLALGSYTPDLCSRTGLDTAIKWFVSPGPHTELQLLSAATIIEHMVSRFQKIHGVIEIVGRQDYEPLDAHFRFSVQDLKRRVQDAETRRRFGRIEEKLSYLNVESLKVAALAMADGYGVSLIGLARRAIKAAIVARNTIVHDPAAYQRMGFERMYGHVAILRELLARTFLTLLGYQGRYHSMLNGPRWITFPLPPEPPAN